MESDRNGDPLAHGTLTDTDHPPPHTRHTHTAHILTHTYAQAIAPRNHTELARQ